MPVLKNAREAFLDSLTSRCRELTGEELIALDRVVERKLYDIDSADLHAVTGGSDDRFLYARGFIVAMGRRFYYAVAADLQMAVPWAEFEEMCYFFAHLHVERYRSFPDTGSGISRESCVPIRPDGPADQPWPTCGEAPSDALARTSLHSYQGDGKNTPAYAGV